VVCCGRATTYYSWMSYPWISRIRKLAPLRPTRGRRTRGSIIFPSWRHYVLLVDVVPVDQSYSQAGATTSYSWTSYPWINHIPKLAPLRPTRGRRTRGSVVFASWRHYVLLVDVVPVDQAYSQAGATTSYSWTSYPWIKRIRKLAPLRPTGGRRTRGSIAFARWRLHVLLVNVVPVDQSYSQAGVTTSYSWTSYPWINRIRRLVPLRPSRLRRTRGSVIFASWRHYVQLVDVVPRGSIIFASWRQHVLLVDVVPVDQSYSQAGATTSYSWTSYPRISHIRKLAPARPTRGRRSGRSVPLSLRVLYVVRRRQRPQSAARRRIRPRLRTVRSVQRYKNYAINYDKWSKNFL